MINQIQKEKNSLSFTLLEVIISIFLLITGIIGILILISQIIAFTRDSVSRLTAIYLAQEGIEIVRNIRDSNLLTKCYKNAARSYHYDININTYGWEADYNDEGLFDSYDGDFLFLDSEGFYNYDTGTPTKFKRKINISDRGSIKFTVTVEVFWIERGKQNKVTLKEILYDLCCFAQAKAGECRSPGFTCANPCNY